MNANGVQTNSNESISVDPLSPVEDENEGREGEGEEEEGAFPWPPL